jgi:hypothetical protein
LTKEGNLVDDGAFHLLQLLYFMLPAYLANMAPPFTRRWKGWNRPLNVRLFGDHKTVLGFACGVAVGLLATGVQAALALSLSIVDYGRWPWLGLGFGFGAMAGDSLKSLFKRKLGIAPGSRWIPMDQLDYVIGALVLAGWQARLSWLDVAIILVGSLLAGFVVNHLAFWLRIKDTPW